MKPNYYVSLAGIFFFALHAFTNSTSGASENRNLLWAGGQSPGTKTLLNAASNIVSAAIGEQGILVLQANGGVSLAEMKPDSVGFQPPANLTNATLISALGNAAGALRADGRVVTWGVYPRPPPPGLSNVVALAVGGDVSLALRSDGTVATWRDSGVTGLPADLRDVVAISTSWTYNNSLALRADGTVAAWGSRSVAADIVPEEATNVVAIAAGLQENFALRADGVVVGWGNGQEPRCCPVSTSPFYPFEGVTNIVDIAAGPSHVLAITSGGHVLEFGGRDLGIANALYVSPVDARGFLVLTGDGSPLIVNEPSDTAGYRGERLRLVAKVGGTRPLALQWLKDGTSIPGATNATLLIDDARSTDAGSYQITATNALGGAVSRIATLRVMESAPVVRRIAMEPTTHTPFIGGAVTFFGEVTGSAPTSFQWLLDGVPVPGATNSTLSLENLRRDQSGNYSLRVSNPIGTTTSFIFPLNVSELVIWGNDIIQQRGVPITATNLVAVATSGTDIAALRADGTVVVWGLGQDFPELAPPPGLSNIVAIASGGGVIVALKADGHIVGWGWNFAALRIPPNLSNIVAISPFCALRSDGTLLVFGENIEAERIAVGVDNAVALNTGGGLVVRSDGTVVSLIDDIPVPSDLTNVVAVAGGRSNAQALRGDGTVVQWGRIYEVNLIPQPADLDDVVALANGGDHVLALRANGRVVGWGAEGLATVPDDLHGVAAIAAGYTHSMAIVDNGPPRIFQQPHSFDGIIGANARLVVNAIGAQPLRYQWRVNGFELVGATNSVLALDGLSFLDNADYDVVVSNERGSVTSQTASITARVSPPLNVRLQVEPATGAALLGGSALFSVHAEGSGPFAYEWLHNAQPISNSREAVLRLSNLSYADAGEYSVVVANAFGTSTSAPVRLSLTEVAAWGGDFDRETEVPRSATNVVAVFSGMRHGVALREDGTLAVWGNTPKDGGMLGGGALVPPAGLSKVVAVAGGDGFNVALKADGRLVAWGDNSFGQISGLNQFSNIVAVSAGHAHTLALRADGTILGVGGNYDGQLDFPAGVNDYVAVAAGLEFSLALRANGTLVQVSHVYYFGDFLPPPPPPEATNIVAIAAGQYHALALRADGMLFEWGIRNNDAVPRPGSLTNVVSIAAGAHHDLALLDGGHVAAWGADWLGQAEVPPALQSVIGISAGYAHSLALIGGGPPRILQQPLSFTAAAGRNARLVVSASGTQPFRYQWRQDGRAMAGATSPVLALDDVSFFDATDYDVIVSNAHGSSTSRVATLSITFQPPSAVRIQMEPTNGIAYLGGTARLTAIAQGSPPFGYQWLLNGSSILGTRSATLQLDYLTPADAGRYSVAVANPFGSSISAPVRLSVVQVAAWGGRNIGSDNRVFDVPASVTNAIAVSASQSHVLALRPDGTVVGWGDPYGGKLPVPASASNLVSVAAGGEFSLGLRRDGTVLVWGDQANNYGVGNLPQGLTNVVQLCAAYSWALALKADGTVAQWGTYIGGWMKPPPAGLANVVQISAGARHALALLRDGTVVGWGSDDCSQANPPANLSNVVQVVAGNCYSMALRNDGSVVEWGRETYAPPSDATNLVAIATGNFHRVGLRDDGVVFSWGFENGGAGQIRVPTDLPPVIAIAAAGDASFGLLPATAEPHIARHPRRQTLFTGEPLRLEASVFPGAAPVTYRWFRNGVELPSQTNAVLEIASATLGDAGRYSVRATNALGSDTSREAEVTVMEQAPVILSQPADVVTYAGGSGSFGASATGSAPLSFQWFFDGAPLPGATNATLIFPRAKATDAGAYQIVISNSLGLAVSRLAQLRLVPAVFLAQTEVPVDVSGRFTFKVRISEPLPSDVRVRLTFFWTFADFGTAREAFVVIAAGSIEQCAAIQDTGLAQALTAGLSGELHLLESDVAVIASPAEAIFRQADPDEHESGCDSVAGAPARFLPGGLQRQADGTVELSFSTPTEGTFIIESSIDLQHWWPVDGTFAMDPAGHQVWFIDLEARDEDMRFYRVRSE
ncbi:MAG TPA: immunoglobulin domain-containing protein [Verrucomicrobiae bacterium]|nr:immunoglobulin domain-containing protein [Verrucomicrobiae bacterium]